MSTALTTPSGLNLFMPERLLTIADVAALPSELPSGPVRYELNHGRLVVIPPPGGDHGGSQTRFAAALFAQGQQRGHGECFTDTGVILRRNPDRLVGPDVAFVAAASSPARFTKEGYLETIPDLIVEIRSKNDTTPEVLGKVQEYLDAGARVVWVADPDSVTVTEYRRNLPPTVYQADDTLTVNDVIPGFALKVRDGFR